MRSNIHKLLGSLNLLVYLLIISIALPLYVIYRLLVSAWRSIFSVESINGKVVLITGAALGIGEQLAYEYAKRGACLALIDINDDHLKQVCDKAREIGSPDVIWVKADVSKILDSHHFVRRTIDHFGQLDLLVNNAGIFGPQTLFENLTDVSILHNVMATNFWGSLYTTHFAIPHLRRSKGKIIVMASSLGHITMPKTSIYNASKAALISLYETLRVELGRDIGITIVTPGAIDTGLTGGEYLSNMGSMRSLPLMSARECAEQIVEGSCRGDAYIRVPGWINPGLLVKALFPELAFWLIRCLFFNKGTRSRKMS